MKNKRKFDLLFEEIMSNFDNSVQEEVPTGYEEITREMIEGCLKDELINSDMLTEDELKTIKNEQPEIYNQYISDYCDNNHILNINGKYYEPSSDQAYYQSMGLQPDGKPYPDDKPDLDDEEPTTEYAILDIDTEEVIEFGDDPVQLMETISNNEEDGTWEENKYGVFERQGEDGEWEISEVVGTSGGGWR